MTYAETLQQNLAAESDRRTTASEERWWTTIDGDYAIVDERYNWRLEEAEAVPRYSDDEVTLFTVLIHMEVCPLCGGRGRYVNPSIDAHGLSREDFDEDPDFAEDYFGGVYDVRCELCRGDNVVPVPDGHDPNAPKVIRVVEEWANDLAQMRAEQLAEMRMGA